MKKLFFSATVALTYNLQLVTNNSFAQTTYFTDNFEKGSTQWKLPATTGNYWTVSNAVGNNSKNSLYISEDKNKTNYFDYGYEGEVTTQTIDINTIGAKNLLLDFVWMCAGAQDSAYGDVGYSIDGGAKFTYLKKQYFGQTFFTNEAISLPQSTTNIKDLRIIFRWQNWGTGGGTGGNNSPSFTVDDVMVSSGTAAPVADFGASKTNLCVGDCINFMDSSSNNPTQWQWNFTGAKTTFSNQQNPKNICYNKVGTYQVQLTARNAKGSNMKVKTDYIVVSAKATADAGKDVTICNGETVDLSASGGNSYSWFPFTGLNNSNIANPSVNPTVTTTYTVTVISGCGQKSDDVVVTVDDCTPASTIYYENFEKGGNTIDTNTTDMGGGSPINFWVVNNSYNGSGGKTINGMLDCGGGTAQQFSYQLNDTPTQPSAISGSPKGSYLHTLFRDAQKNGYFNSTYIGASFSGCPAAESIFSKMNMDVNTSGVTNVYLSFWWMLAGSVDNFGEVYYSTDTGVSWNLIVVPFAQYYNQSTWKKQTISLPVFSGQNKLRFGFRFVNNISQTADDPGFSIDEIKIIGNPTGPLPEADFAISSINFCAGKCISFKDYSTNEPTNWYWIFDGANPSTSAEQYPTDICYENAGVYSVYLMVTNANGSVTISKTITVNPLPAASFTYFTDENIVSFTNTTADTSTTIKWDFGDGGKSSKDNALHAYSSNGNYLVQLIATNSCGSDTAADSITINSSLVGVDEFRISDGQFRIYPNPTDGRLTIEIRN